MKKYYFIRFKNLLLTLGLILSALCSNAQNIQVSLILSPPYSPYFSDYLQYQNRGFMTVIDPDFVNGTSKQVYMIGNIIGDNGVALITKKGYKPPSPIFLNSSSQVTTLKGSDFADIFSRDNMDVTGASIEKLVQNDGLPEGNYTICVQVFDFATDAPLSGPAPNGCFVLPIKHIEPPIPITPICGNDVFLTTPQNVVFSWSYPVGAPVNTKYLLRIVPLINAAQNPTDALNTITTPAFFEKELPITTYVYNITDPILVPNQTYAWRVIAFDPNEKVLFRNNGVSEACTFTTKNMNNKDQDLLVANTTLFLTKPDCSKPNRDTTLVSSEDDFTISWQWKSKTSKGKDTVILNKQPLEGINIWNYRITIKSMGKQGKNKAAVSENFVKVKLLDVNQPNLITYTQADCNTMGMISNHWYEVIVEALDKANLKTMATTKCETMYFKVIKKDVKKITIQGKLNYQFETFPEKTGANYVNLRCEIVDAEIKNSGQLGGNAFTVVCKTDPNGNFTVDVPDKLEIGKKYLRVDIENVYYAKFSKNFPLFNPSAPANQPILYGDTLVLPDLVTTAYKNKLKVNIAMGFPDFFYDTLNKNYKYDATFSVDELTITPKAKIPANIKMILYRVSKVGIIPQYEGQGIKPLKWNNEDILVVSEGNVQKEMVNGVEKAFVVFDRLLPSFYDGDEYFLKAKFLPKSGESDNAEIKTEDLDAPVLKVKIKRPTHGPQAHLLSFTSSIEYRLISNKPPISKIKGKLVYLWASDGSKQVRPLANTEFRIINVYKINGTEFNSFVGGCKGEIHALLDNYGKEIPSSDNKSTVGVGTTDENGNFEIEVVNINSKGTIANLGQDVVEASWNKCNEKSQKEDPSKKSILESLIEEIFDPWEGGLFDEGQFQNDYGAGMNFGNNLGQGFQPTANEGLNNSNILVNGLGGAAAGLGAGANKKLQGGIGSGPSILEGEEATAEAQGGAKYPIKRVYQIKIDGYPTNFYTNPINMAQGNSNEIVCQAFETLDIGVFTSTVKEMTAQSPEILHNKPEDFVMKINVLKKKPGGGSDPMPGFNLATAKFVVFRGPGTSTALFPKGEGSMSHPFKPLVQPTLKTETIKANSGYGDIESNAGKSFEWVIDHPIDIGYASNLNFKDKYLLDFQNAKYYVELTPDPAAGQVMFTPVITYFSYSYVDIYLSSSRIAGRILDNSVKNTTQKGLANAFIMIKNKTLSKYYFLSSDENGYFELVNSSYCGATFVYWGDNSNFDVTVAVSGYKQKTMSAQINSIGQQRILDFAMEPARTFSAKIKNEQGGNVVSFVMRNDSSIYKTDFLGSISNMPLVDNTGIKVTIIPQDVKYFEETITINDNGNIFINPITVKERLHRMQFVIKNKNTNAPINGIEIKIDDDKKCKTMFSGTAQMKFYNVSVNNYTILVSDPTGNYIPRKIELSNLESKDFKIYEIFLEEGMELKGVVKLDDVPIKNAKVYLDIKASKILAKNDVNTGSLQAKTDINGAYKIRGVPKTMSNLLVKASLDTTFAVSGDSKSVELSQNNGNLSFKPTDLSLTSFKGLVLDKVFKFPFETEKIEQNSSGYLVTGLLDFTGKHNGFSGEMFNTKPRILKVQFITQEFSGKTYLVPKNDKITMEVYSIKMTFQEKMNVSLTGASSGKLTLDKDDNEGANVKANTKIIDNSFDFPSSYLSFVADNEFYFSALGSSPPNTLVTTISSSQILYFQGKIFNICNKQKQGVKFKFIGFDAVSDVAKCYIDNNAKIHLNGNMSCKMAAKSQGTIAIQLDEIILSDNKIEVPSQGKPLEIKLEDWTLQVKSWTMSPEKGGLTSTNCLLKTGIVDVPVSDFTLTNKFYYMGGFNLQSISLGGGVLALSEINPSAASLVFDEKTGSDMGPHWKLIIAGKNGKPAAKIAGVTPYLANPLEIEYIQLLSKANESLITLKNAQTPSAIWNNQYVKFQPQVIASGTDYASIAGSMTFAVPRMSSVAAQFIFTKSGGSIKMDVNPIKVEFEGKGYAKFTSSDVLKPKISNGAFEITGTVVEPGKFNAIPAWLKIGAGVSVARIYLPNNGVAGSPLSTDYYLNLCEKSQSPSSVGNNLKLSDFNKNGMYINGNDWTTLKFSGNVIEGTPGGMGKKYIKESNVLNFEVYGEIQASSDKLEVSESTPFGDFKLTYDFPKSRMMGTLHVTEKEINSSMKLEGADFEMCFEPSGWYILGSGKLNTGTFLVEGFGNFNAGFLLGKHTISQDMNNTVTKYSRSNTACVYLDGHKNAFSGFFFTGGWDAIDVDVDYNFGLAWGGVQAYLGVDATLALNFAEPPSFFLAGGILGKAEASLHSIVGTDICAGVSVGLNGSGSLGTKNGLTMNGGANVAVKGCISQWTPFGDITASVDLGAGIDFAFQTAQKPHLDCEFYLGTSQTNNTSNCNKQIPLCASCD